MSTDNQGGGQQAQAQQQNRRSLEPFTVEFADDYCRNHTITTPPLQGLDIRGRWDTSRLAKRPQGMRNLGEEATKIPSPIPGAYLRVDPVRRTVRLFDPLSATDAGKATLEHYNKVAKGVPILRERQPFEAIQHEVDDDQLKTLLIELHRKLASRCIDVVEGTLPSLKQIEQLSGHELYDPSNPGDDKPKYKKDLQAFKDRRASVVQ